MNCTRRDNNFCCRNKRAIGKYDPHCLVVLNSNAINKHITDNLHLRTLTSSIQVDICRRYSMTILIARQHRRTDIATHCSKWIRTSMPQPPFGSADFKERCTDSRRGTNISLSQRDFYSSKIRLNITPRPTSATEVALPRVVVLNFAPQSDHCIDCRRTAHSPSTRIFTALLSDDALGYEIGPTTTRFFECGKKRFAINSCRSLANGDIGSSLKDKYR
ncbi:unannotated protein [freshwater metagenome]|uniref:Unannotated protein n=1 Tax=freshwater metagenome TaxID=449393 RepID=A0A6J7DZU4_9ZZZZ